MVASALAVGNGKENPLAQLGDLNPEIGFGRPADRFVATDTQTCHPRRLTVGSQGDVNQVYENDGGTLKLDPSNGFGWESAGDERTPMV